jgi:hypothetical protein
MVEDAGLLPATEDGVPRYAFFADDLFGLERTIQQVVDYLHSAARRLDVRKRILLLMGPVGGGKSTLVTLVKRGLEAYTRTPEGAVYAIAGCPMHEEPLHLVPDSLRRQLEEEYGIYVEGDLCPVCAQRLADDWGGDIGRAPVERVLFSEKIRVGIGTFAPSDPKSQDISELTGSIDLATVGDYGSESDPRAYRFDGELNIANRGLMEFIELLKSDEKFLYGLLTLSQEQIPMSPCMEGGEASSSAPVAPSGAGNRRGIPGRQHVLRARRHVLGQGPSALERPIITPADRRHQHGGKRTGNGRPRHVQAGIHHAILQSRPRLPETLAGGAGGPYRPMGQLQSILRTGASWHLHHPRDSMQVSCRVGRR